MNDASGRGPGRFEAIDRMRGLVMLLMLIDHVSSAFNPGKFHFDQAHWGGLPNDWTNPENAFVPAQFLTRWMTHLCAPTFVFLAGTALALSVAKRVKRGDSALAIDGHLVARGLILIVFEAWVGLCFGIAVLQVLYAIGASLICMALLRRLPMVVLWALGLLLVVGLEAVMNALGLPTEGFNPPLSDSLLFTSGFYLWDWVPGGYFFVFYPLLPWLGVMLLGWAFGRWLLGQNGPDANERIARRLAICGGLALAAFVAQRLFNDYGNYWLHRLDDHPLRWLQVSKYPPSFAFCALELGIMALCQAAFFRFQRRFPPAPRAPLVVFGQTALFFYLLHLGLILLASVLIRGEYEPATPLEYDLIWTYVASLVAALALYPICLAYRSYKSNHHGGWTQYV